MIRNITLFSNFMTSQPGKQTITIYLNILRSKGNQTMKFRKLIEYNMRIYHFFEKSYTKCDGETIPRHFSKKSKLNYLWINSQFYTVCFLLYAKLRAIEILKESSRPLPLTSYKAFLKLKRIRELICNCSLTRL